jgi:hypothetical protein
MKILFVLSMIGINKICGGRFGNRVLHYNNMIQLAKKYNLESYCEQWEGNSWFDITTQTSLYNNKPVATISWNDILNKNYLTYIETHNCNLDGIVIHNFYYELTNEHPRNLIKIKKDFLPILNKDEINVGIHFRGGDIINSDGNNGREIHTFDYYKKAFDNILSNTKVDNVYLCTDDLNFSTYVEFYLYITNNFTNINIKLGPATENPLISHIYDFGLLSECDFLIATSSTYAICAGFLGKEKKIIHSLEWLNKNIQGDSYVKWGNYTNEYPEAYWKQFDNFWVKVYNGGSDFYKAWLIV